MPTQPIDGLIGDWLFRFYHAAMYVTQVSPVIRFQRSYWFLSVLEATFGPLPNPSLRTLCNAAIDVVFVRIHGLNCNNPAVGSVLCQPLHSMHIGNFSNAFNIVAEYSREQYN